MMDSDRLDEKIKAEYDEYLRRYCTKHAIPREEAEQHVIVKEYKKCLIQKYQGMVEEDDQPSITVTNVSCNCC